MEFAFTEDQLAINDAAREMLLKLLGRYAQSQPFAAVLAAA